MSARLSRHIRNRPGDDPWSSNTHFPIEMPLQYRLQTHRNWPSSHPDGILARHRCLPHNTPPETPRMPDSAPVLHASPLDLTSPPMAGSRRPGHVEHEKKAFFSLLQNSRSEDGNQGRAALQRVHRSEAETLDGHRSGGYARERAGMPIQPRSFALNRFPPQQPKVTPAVTANRTFHPQPPCSQQVPAAVTFSNFAATRAG